MIEFTSLLFLGKMLQSEVTLFLEELDSSPEYYCLFFPPYGF